MSITYNDLYYSQFPDQCDTYEYMQDISIDTYSLAQQYQLLMSQNKLNEAAQLLIDNPNLNRSMLNAEKYNKIIDSIKATQRLYKDDIQTYIMELVTYRGYYSSKTKYSKYDVVTYTSNSMVYMCISLDCPMGILPVDLNYWIPLSIKGDRGETGIGLINYGEWNSLSTYPKDSLVSYNNTLWGAIVENTAIVPSSDTSAVWTRIMEFSSDYATYIDQTTEERYKLVIDDGKIYLEEVM